MKQEVTPKDTFKTIKDFPNYEVNADGLVRNKKTQYILKPSPDTCGYHQVCLSMNGKQKHPLVHRLVAQAFIPNPQGKPCVNHINGHPTDNNVSNLEWCTQSENMLHAYALGLISKAKRSHIKESEVHAICKLLQDGLSRSAVAKALNVSFNVVAHIRRRDTHRPISEHYTW